MNPIDLAKEVEKRYRRYLKTTFYFKDLELRKSFEEALESGHLSKGPYLEATPVFKRVETPRQLFSTLLPSRVDEGFLKAVEDKTPFLYQHQEEAIKTVFKGQNAVVATGTGSGKTEAFLYPILLHLYQEFQAEKLCPGVRALVLYPMNALANDQRERLGEICKKLDAGNSSFRFTFGQYIGETPDDENDTRRHARDHIANRLPGELVLRSEMIDKPPHILLTNYSMLEYLLLRPGDRQLFDKGRAQWWTFLVLDEAHQYRGSRGTEMAMLLRRLKQRLREGGRTEPFKCIATSATLAGGENDIRAVAKFASDLFGEEFQRENVILGETEEIPEPSPEKLSQNDYQILKQGLHQNDSEARNKIFRLAVKLGVSLSENEELQKVAGRLLQRDNRAANLRKSITSKPTEVGKIADRFFDELQKEERVPALSDLVDLLVQAKEPASNAPLLSARYHLFLRSLEGAFVSYWPQKKVFLDRKGEDSKIAAFEVALCRECGQHYFVGPKGLKSGKLIEAVRDPSDVNFGATFFRPDENDLDNEEGEEGEEGRDQAFCLCMQCGEIAREKTKCEHKNSIRVVKENSKDEDNADQIARCGACGYSAAGRDPVREVVHGTDGPHSVIATTLYQHLPDLPDRPKKILAFADGRQEAAFFAWYLEDTYKDILSRNVILKIICNLTKHSSEGISLSTIVDFAFDKYRDAFKERETDDPLKIRKNIWRALYKEFLTDEQRISLEGVGLLGWSIKWPNWLRIPEVLQTPPWSLTPKEAQDLLYVLLDSMRTDKAVEIQTENGVSLNWNDLGLQTTQMKVRIGRPNRPKGAKSWPIKSWNGKQTKRAQFLAKLLIRNGIRKQEAIIKAEETLRAIWDDITRFGESVSSSGDRLFFSIDDARRMNPNWWRLHPIADGHPIFKCDTCGRLASVSVRGVCTRHRCTGTLKPALLQDLEQNHYRFLYEENLPNTLRVEEHTAQLDKEKAREFQKEFREGKIHVLSCSTTFELGVDLGDLDTIFLRNVPPEAFNYAQRVGRAGRRSGFPGFAITYCRRNPHDLYHFSEPERMLSGKAHPPTLSLRNEKIIIRHIAATALSRFFITFPERFKTVEALFKDLTNPSGAADFKGFLLGEKIGLEKSLQAICPLDANIGLSDGTWMERISGDESKFVLVQDEVSSDYKEVVEHRKSSYDAGDDKAVLRAGNRAKTIAQEKVLTFLSRKAVIPKYGFPVDVVELDTQQTKKNYELFEVSLQRDLSIAISEFAPTSKLLANKKVWTSYGLKKVAGKEWDRWWYARCLNHNYFKRRPWHGEDQHPPFEKCCSRIMVTQYIDPRFGFVTDWDGPENPKSRPVRVFTTRPYFAGFKEREGEKISFGAATLTTVSPGYMVVLCEGRRGEGFYICRECGAGFRKMEKSHKSSYGLNCIGKLDQASLGHEFITDVLKIQFQREPEGVTEFVWFAYSLAYALVEGAAHEDVLEIPSTDLSATVEFAEQTAIPPIVLYDNVPGGAGLVARLENEKVFKACLEAALKRISGNCGCAESTSCYGCLRNYRNQFAHQNLQRGPVKRYLEEILTSWR